MRAITTAISIVVLTGAFLLLPRFADSAEAPPAGEKVATEEAVVDMPGDDESVVVVQRSKVQELFTIPMLPLWICSLVLVALIFERYKALRPTNVLDEGMTKEVTDLIAELEIEKAQEAAAGSKAVVGMAWAQGLKEFMLGGVSLQEALTNSTLLSFKPLKRNLQVMSTIAGISPLLGLLGTIIGMIMVFDQIAVAGGADKGKLAEGIMVALFTTAFGLIIAIPGIISNRYFTGRVVSYAEKAEADINRIKYRYTHARSERGENGDVPYATEE